MGQDRIVRFAADSPFPAPTPMEVEAALRGFLGEAGLVECGNDTWITVQLRGKPSAPFPERRARLEDTPERFFEVFCVRNYLSVITRGADDYTAAVAEGFAKVCAYRWSGGRVER